MLDKKVYMVLPIQMAHERKAGRCSGNTATLPIAKDHK